MKSFNKLFIALGLSTMALVSCTDDLDNPVIDANDTTPEAFAQDPKGYMDRVLAECYQGLATSGYGGPGNSIISGGDAGANSFTRAIFVCNELTTDEFAWKQFGDAGQYELATMQLAADNGVMYTTYSRIYTCIALCNEFIRTVDAGKFYLTEDLIPISEEYKRQVKVLRGLCYFYAIDMFGNAGYSDETFAAGTAPAQWTRVDLYNKVVGDLEAISAEWGDSYVEPSYGYVGKECCDALLAKFYLNAEVYTGTPAYDKCWNICQKIINHHKGDGFNGSGLAQSYKAVFGANNDEYMAQGSRVNEIIWGIPQDGDNLQNYGGTTFYMAAGSSTSTPGVNMTNASTGLNASWTCMNARQQFSEKFSWNANGVSDDLRAELWITSKDGAKITNESITNFADGYVPVKYTNYAYDEEGNIDDELCPPASNAFADADWAVIRLAEIYLSAAEANVVGGAGNQADALTYVNYIRERAGVDAWSVAQLTPDNLLDERSRELYGENVRRTDLVRHGKYAGSAYNWNWKGNVGNGGTGTPEHMNLFPIPATVISFQGYKQNPGY
ncbi:MAG: RagB/SusD family nutrient uptake outer membrane protein [Muribaculaceae bacterium]|nr:RagB/SusD family nutrient uptake outer membrane protein [Muribaculaceae bacterium]